MVRNTGNVPLMLDLPGTACHAQVLQPAVDSAVCDFAWSVTQPELELGLSFVQLSVNGTELLGSGSSAAYTGAALLHLVQTPSVQVEAEQLQPAGYLEAGAIWFCPTQ